MPALRDMGVVTNRTECGLCIGNEEDTEHILRICPFVVDVRKLIFEWCGIVDVLIYNVNELTNLANNRIQSTKWRKRLIVIYYGLMWNLWKCWNIRLFS